jgi:hypothetical protein
MIWMNTDPIETMGSGQREKFWVGRQWAVTAYGLELRDGTFSIEASQLLDDAALPDRSVLSEFPSCGKEGPSRPCSTPEMRRA